jgi:hypothetical protein
LDFVNEHRATLNFPQKVNHLDTEM